MSSLRQNGRIQDAVSWFIVGIVALADVAWIILSDFQIDLFGTSNALFGLLIIGGLLWFYCTYRYNERIAAALSAVLLLVMFTSVAAPLSYLCASLARPFWDNTLHGWDEALGLDWRAYLAWVNERPLLGTLLKVAYASLLPQMIIACIGLGFTGRLLQLRSFILAVIVSGVLCIIISAVMPAITVYVHLGLQPTDHSNVIPAAAYAHVEHLHAVRIGTLRTLDLSTSQGIVAFPSYHAALGIILMTAVWRVSLLRWPSAGLNITLIAATPIFGGHYFIDVGAGMFVAVLSLLAASRLSRSFAHLKTAVPLGPVSV